MSSLNSRSQTTDQDPAESVTCTKCSLIGMMLLSIVLATVFMEVTSSAGESIQAVKLKRHMDMTRVVCLMEIGMLILLLISRFNLCILMVNILCYLIISLVVSFSLGALQMLTGMFFHGLLCVFIITFSGTLVKFQLPSSDPEQQSSTRNGATDDPAQEDRMRNVYTILRAAESRRLMRTTRPGNQDPVTNLVTPPVTDSILPEVTSHVTQRPSNEDHVISPVTSPVTGPVLPAATGHVTRSPSNQDHMTSPVQSSILPAARGNVTLRVRLDDLPPSYEELFQNNNNCTAEFKS